jgi:hypothetical protein
VSRLELLSRPLVAFDAANIVHRQHWHAFLQTNGWGSCPVRFIVPEDHGDLVTMIQRSLVQYYVEQEFTKPNRRSRG